MGYLVPETGVKGRLDKAVSDTITYVDEKKSNTSVDTRSNFSNALLLLDKSFLFVLLKLPHIRAD